MLFVLTILSAYGYFTAPILAGPSGTDVDLTGRLVMVLVYGVLIGLELAVADWKRKVMRRAETR